MNRFRLYLHRHPKIQKILFLGDIILLGCFAFPFGNARFPLDFFKLYFGIVGYEFIAVGFAGIYGIHKEKSVYIVSLVLTGLGMACRYILEYGEVSNTMNFTPFNIISYLVVIPIFIVVAYHFSIKYLIKKN